MFTDVEGSENCVSHPHWLDGCYVRSLTNGLAPVERSLKLHALLGDTLVLSDVQLIDSPIVSRLFSDHQFRAFLARNPNFLELVSDTDQVAVDTLRARNPRSSPHGAPWLDPVRNH